VERAVAVVSAMFPHDGEAGVKLEAPRYLVMPEVLEALGITHSAVSARFAFQAGDDVVTAELAPGTEPPSKWLRPPGPRPLRRERPDAPFWFQRVGGALYLKYDTCGQAERFAALTRELLADLDRGGVERVIVDLRDNGGGNSEVFRPFLAGLAPRHLPVTGLIGRATFSSAMMNALQLRQELSGRLIGEPTSGKPNHYGEVKYFMLPRSALPVDYSTKFFRHVPGDPPALEPDVVVEPTWADERDGRDPVLEAALSSAR
jgi:hypothetical protein